MGKRVEESILHPGLVLTTYRRLRRGIQETCERTAGGIGDVGKPQEKHRGAARTAVTPIAAAGW